jgi:uncharacterized membrane protein YeaQ/YmgE (transglycosylase-associated protein family)
MSILWTIIIGFVAGLIAKFLHPGNKNEPSGFILTTLLGIAGAFAATFVGQAIGWYKAGEGAGFIGAIVGAIIVLVVWGLRTGLSRESHDSTEKYVLALSHYIEREGLNHCDVIERCEAPRDAEMAG